MADTYADDDDAAHIAAPLPSMGLYPDAIEDSYAAVYALVIVAPLTALFAQWLRGRGLKTTQSQALLLSFLFPALLIAGPLWYQWMYGDPNVYRMLQMNRFEGRYVWAQKYAFWKNLYQKGEMPVHIWQQIDTAYDNIYDENARVGYDFWGPYQTKMSIGETQFNTGLFYVLWAGIVYSITSPTPAQGASQYSFAGLVLLFCFEVAVKLMHYDPKIGSMFPYTTPREFVLWGHRLFPIFVFGVLSIQKVYFIDMQQHRIRQLRHMLQNNKETKEELGRIKEALFRQEKEDEADENSIEATM